MDTNHRKILDLAAAGNWHEAHNRVQSSDDSLSCQIHAYLHRVEGDDWNAAYWYRKAGVERPDNSIDEELDRLYSLLADP